MSHPSSPSPTPPVAKGEAMLDEDLEKRLAAARERKADRDKEAEKADKLRELERLELEERFAKEVGPLGEKFTLVDAGARGTIALVLGLNVLHKQFNASIDDNQKKGSKTGVTEENCNKFVRPCVKHPSLEEFKSIVEDHPGVLYTCAGALGALYDANLALARGKS